MLQYFKDYYNYLLDYWFYKNDDNIIVVDINKNDNKINKNKYCVDQNIKFDSYISELKYVLEQRKNK